MSFFWTCFLEHFEKLHTFVCFFCLSISELYCILQCRPCIKHQGHKKKENDHQPKIVKQILLLSTLFSIENIMENIHTDGGV